MKYGYRKPSVKKSISARTTGKVNRTIKKSINPTYGKKGIGWVNNPKRAAYNKVYNKTSRSILKDVSIEDGCFGGCMIFIAFLFISAMVVIWKFIDYLF